MSRRWRRLPFVGLAALAVVLTGCLPAADVSWQPRPWPESPVSVPTGEGSSTAPSADLPPPGEAVVPHVIRNDPTGVRARWFEVPGFEEFNAAVQQVIRDEIDARVQATGHPYTPQVHPTSADLGDRMCIADSTGWGASTILTDPRLGPRGGTGVAIACDLTIAAGTTIGQSLRIVTGAEGVVASDRTVHLVGDRVTREVVPADELWQPAVAQVVWTAAVESLRRTAGSLSLALVEPPSAADAAVLRSALARGTLEADGTIGVILPAGFAARQLDALGAFTAEPHRISVDPHHVEALLTDAGRRMLHSLGEPYEAGLWISAGRRPIDCALLPCVALTYDDGPSDLTADVLDAFAARDAAATFFVLGASAEASPETIRRSAAEGHLVQSHTWSHPDLTKIPDPEITAQMQRTDAVLTDLLGAPSQTYRPPYGEVDARVQAAVGKAAILWDVDTNDWRGPSDAALINHAVNEPHPSSIVLMHDVHEVTARSAGAILDGLRDRGFVAVTIAQLFGGDAPSGGVWRSAR